MQVRNKRVGEHSCLERQERAVTNGSETVSWATVRAPWYRSLFCAQRSHFRNSLPFPNPEKTSKKVIMNSPTKCSHNSSPGGEGIGRNSTKVLCAIRDDLDSEMSDRSLLSVGNWSPRLRSRTRAVAQSVVCVTVKLAALVVTGKLQPP